MKKIKALEIIKSVEGILKLQELGAEIFIVGGCVRDHFLDKESKDIDIIVCKIDADIIISTLEKFGRIDKVGETFGVIKFTPKDWVGEPIDIAQPRVDMLIDKTLGHHGIKAMFDKDISIDDDLLRRDFTINSIAVSLDGTIIDPFDGLKDIKNKIIRATSKTAFTEDPLRMMRAIQFSARFGFFIESETWKMIAENASDIKSISGERIKDELDKIFFKGDITKGLIIFAESGLHEELFSHQMSSFDSIITLEDFFFIICSDSKVFKTVLKGEVDTSKGIEAIQKLIVIDDKSFKKTELRQLMFDAIKISKSILESGLLSSSLKEIQQEFKDDKFPKKITDLKIGGDILMSQGFQGSEIGKRQRELLVDLFSEKRQNTLKDLSW